MLSSGKGCVGEPSTDIVSRINYVSYAVLAMVIVAVGIVGNVLNLVVLSRPKLKGVMYVYLLGLAVSNLCVLITAIPALMDIAGEIQSKTYFTAFFQAHLELPLLNSFMASSVYIIICMTVNRYISIYRPTQFQRIHTFRNAYVAIAFSFIGGTILHIPLAFEAEVVSIHNNNNNNNNSNNSSNSMDCFGFEAKPNSEVVNHFLFRIYLWASELLLRLGPIVLLTILNALIIVRFRRIAMRREVLRGGAAGGSLGQQRPSVAGSVVNVNGDVALLNKEGNLNKAGNASKESNLSKEGQPKKTSFEKQLAIASTTGDATTSTALTSGYMSALSNSTLAAPSPMRAAPRRASSRRRGLHSPEERMLVVVLIAIVVLFLVCTTPAAFLSILVTDALKKRVWFALFRACANNLELLCFALNFFVYCLCSADIRQAFVDVLCDNALAKRILGKKDNNNNNNNFENNDENNGNNGQRGALLLAPIRVEAPTALNDEEEEVNNVNNVEERRGGSVTAL